MSDHDALSPSVEARALLHLLKQESPEQIREQILGGNPDLYRKQTALFFDVLCLRVSLPALRAGRVKLLNRSNGRFKPGPSLRAEVLTRLRSGKSTHRVARELRVVHSAVRRIAEANKNAFAKVGRGRRFTPEKVQELVAALRSGTRPSKLIRLHHVSAQFLLKLRRTRLNDFTDGRRPHGYDIEQVKQALAVGMGLPEIVSTFGIDRGPLWKLRKKMGDVEDRRHRNIRIFSETERAAIFADIRAGISQRAISHKFHTHTQQVRELQGEICMPPKRKRAFTADERKKIIRAIAEGKTNVEIAREMQCARETIWQIRKKWKESRLGMRNRGECTIALPQTEARFREMQERLKQFIEEHMQYSAEGLEFVNERGRDRFAIELAALRQEHDAAGAAWAEALTKATERVRQ